MNSCLGYCLHAVAAINLHHMIHMTYIVQQYFCYRRVQVCSIYIYICICNYLSRSNCTVSLFISLFIRMFGYLLMPRATADANCKKTGWLTRNNWTSAGTRCKAARKGPSKDGSEFRCFTTRIAENIYSPVHCLCKHLPYMDILEENGTLCVCVQRGYGLL